jgi:hypothetical protein
MREDVGVGATTAVFCPLTFGPLSLSYPTLAMRIGNSRQLVESVKSVKSVVVDYGL